VLYNIRIESIVFVRQLDASTGTQTHRLVVISKRLLQVSQDGPVFLKLA